VTSTATNAGNGQSFEPPWPTLAALGLCTLWIVILSLPMWSGQLLAGPFSDQYATGYVWRHWQAEHWRAMGHIPQWNGYIFGGLPYIAGSHGDIFYPTAWIRLLLPTAFAMDLGFVVHYVLAGFFTYLLLRRLGISWTGGVVGGLGYQLAGVIGSYVQPGHDGKLYVTALLPLALLALLLAIRERRFEGYALLSLTVGLALLSPQVQMTQYMLIAAGFFTLYLTFGEPGDRSIRSRISDICLAFAAVVVGFLISAIQLWPFWQYIPYSPRAESYRGFEGATTFAIPWEHVPEFFFSRFVGDSVSRTYWGSNGLKLHSEYLGLPLIALAVLGAATRDRKKLVLWLGGIGVLFLLVTLGSSTPFYRLWYAVVPYVKQTRAPGMALYVVALILAVFAGLGVDRLLRREGDRHVLVWLAGGALVVVLALAGVFGGVATFLAQGIEQALGMAVASVAAGSGSAIMAGAIGSGGALLLLGVLSWAWLQGHLRAVSAVSLGLALLVSGDLWRNARSFWVFSRVQQELHAPDQVIRHIQGTARPYRILNLAETRGSYPGSSLMAHDIPQLLGHHGMELHRFDELMGGKNQWRNLLGGIVLWDLYAIEHVIVPSGFDIGQAMAGFSERYQPALDGVTSSAGGTVDLYSRREPASYARLLPAAVKAPDDQAIATVVDPRFSADLFVLLDPAADIEPPGLSGTYEALSNSVAFDSWETGRMRLRIEPPADREAYLLIAENWYPDWHAAVDGVPAQVIRGNVSMLTVPVSAGAHEVELWFDSQDYHAGRIVTLIGVLLVGVGLVLPPLARRRSGG